jgi:hypothetical protein
LRPKKISPKKFKITKKEKDAALEKMSVEELMMKNKEVSLRDSVNKELNRRGYHLRVSFLNYSQTDMGFNYIEPIHNWANELPAVNQLVIDKIKEAQKRLLSAK